MDRKRLLKHLVSLMFFIFIVSILNTKFYWDSLLWYFDVIMHTLGGLWVGMFFLYVFGRSGPSYFNLMLVVKVLVATLLIGVFWEIYQFYIYQYISRTPFDLKDVSSDVFFDLLGAMFSFLYFKRFIMIENKDRVE